MNDQARQILFRLIRDYGSDLAYDAQRLNALFKDYAQGQFKREIFLCVQAVREGVVVELLNNRHLPIEALSLRLSKQLQDDCGFDSAAADWALETWLLALGLVRTTGAIKRTQPPITPTVTITNPITNVSVTPQPQTKLPPATTSNDDVLDVLIDDGISWVKNLFGLQISYINNGDGTVTDSHTGLQWIRFSLGQYWNGKTCEGRAQEYTLQEGLNAVKHFNHNRSLNCGHSDWRIPTWEELRSIRIQGTKVIDSKAFPKTPNSRFWTLSESTSPNLTGIMERRFYTVNFNRFNPLHEFGTARPQDKKYIRLVR